MVGEKDKTRLSLTEHSFVRENKKSVPAVLEKLMKAGRQRALVQAIRPNEQQHGFELD